MGDQLLVTLMLLLCYIPATQNQEDGQTSRFSNYAVVKPQLIQRRWTRNADRHSKSGHTEAPDSISYSLIIDDKEHVLHLKINKDFLSPNFVQYSHTASVNPTATYPNPVVHCYYHGHVRDHEDSLVALSTCSGLRGVILLGNDSYGLEPIKQSSTNEHLLYRLEHSQSEPFFCGVTTEASQTESHSHFDPSHKLTALLRKKRNLPQTRYIELVLVVDYLRYTYKKSNETAVSEEMVELANLLDGYYKQLNVRVVLVGLEIFKIRDPFNVTDSPENVLGNFVKWRQTNLLPRVRNDDAQLIVGLPGPYSGGILGMAFVGTVCSASSAGGINVFSDNNLTYVSTVVAHEMGHNLGMIHDVYPSCTCQGPGGTCIMNTNVTGSTVFSSCSASNFESLVLGGGGVCLLNPATSTLTVPQCGNGILETGEQCDCGTPQNCTNKCCNAATCTLTSGSTCAQGSCCQDCQVIVSGTPCRGSVNTCDLPEYCNGSAPTCPSDFYVMDGLPCQDNTAYCYEGRCQTYDYQCQQLFAPGGTLNRNASKAADICFQTANLIGDKYGNCGITSTGAYVKCKMANVMCGKLQCTNVDTNNPPPGRSVSNQIINRSSCVNADFNLGPDVLDPAYVHHGSPCATGKACVSFRCVNATALLAVNLTCDAQTTCNGRGVCNNMGHCHCNDGWGPPYCDRSGRGGSVDSGPAQIDYSRRNGLLIFFLLVVPVLILLVFVFRRDSLEPCFQKLHRRKLSCFVHRPGNTTNGQTMANLQRRAPPQPPPHPPLPHTFHLLPQRPDAQNALLHSARTPFQKQGPGVPRPIPTRQKP
ncbi:disintegrin and metalloproteinase domain-containing protein 9-like isoform X1 [Esox lucius]|nr:disintegrin and metalloproteinase domain-containing protein 9-like isoform X1 [Esox lucius]